MTPDSSTIAYFSMEIALDPSMPTYSGGLGVLAGDTLRAAADLGVPMVGVTLVHRKGYFDQRLDQLGKQSETPTVWKPEEVLEPMGPTARAGIEGREVKVRAWRYLIKGVGGHVVPVYLLDTALPANSPWDQGLTDHLYGGDAHYRLCQEVVLGMSGVDILRNLGHCRISSYHMNEGHSALLILALLEQQVEGRDLRSATEKDLLAVRHKCVFTTHTPVPAGQDQFPRNLVSQVLGERRTAALEATGACREGSLNMTYLALFGSSYINGVAMQHGEVSRSMFPRYPIRAITNGVHAVTWTAPSFRDLYDRHIPEWRHDNLYLRYAIAIPVSEVREAHSRAKLELLRDLKERAGIVLDEKVITVGFARRAATYKRADLLFRNPERLRWIVNHVGPLQIIFGGKAHPRDEGGKGLILRIFESAAALKDAVRVVYLENYDWRRAPLLYAGVDLWLNTPKRPQEASGTSGMKAALNGVPSFSVMDGWWVEGCLEGITGWAIGHGPESPDDEAFEVASLYDKLEMIILPMFYGRPTAYAEVMRSAIAINGSFFNTQRMLSQYLANAYLQETAL
ncbi:MAG TPA: alpha-glucan family phosphorylase [Terriglobia bacterium]|nr:alpha-glucan family phosphorylase [Terriglobia bacterium]